MQTKGNSWTDVIEKSSLSSGTTWCRCSIDGIRSDSLIPMLTFPLCYLPSQAGSPFRVVSSRFTFGHLSNPSGAGSFPFSVVPAEVPGLALIGSPRANRWIGVVFSLAWVSCLLLELGDEGETPKSHDCRKWGWVAWGRLPCYNNKEVVSVVQTTSTPTRQLGRNPL